MAEFSGSCLCGDLSFKGDGEIMNVANCHCLDCRKATGAAYATLAFVKTSDVELSGDSITHEHKSDKGSDMVKHACAKCGSPVYGTNSARDGVLALRAGAFDQLDLIEPKVNVYTSSKIPSTPMNADLKAFDKLPG